MTVIGDAVKTASRLQELSRECGCELVVSEAVVERAGCDLADFPWHEIETRGRREMLAVKTLPRAAELPASLQTRRARPRKNFVDDQAASPSSWKTPRMAVWMAA
jgi:class 3 adenylate cyclase